MSITLEPEVTEQSGEDLLGDLDSDWQIACDIPRITQELGVGFPQCRGEAAVWVAYRGKCCTRSPNHMLLCDFCKRTFQSWHAHEAALECGWCGEPTSHLTYVPIRRAA